MFLLRGAESSPRSSLVSLLHFPPVAPPQNVLLPAMILPLILIHLSWSSAVGFCSPWSISLSLSHLPPTHKAHVATAPAASTPPRALLNFTTDCKHKKHLMWTKVGGRARLKMRREFPRRWARPRALAGLEETPVVSMSGCRPASRCDSLKSYYRSKLLI